MGAVREVFAFPYFYHLPSIVRGKVLGGSSAVNFLAWTSPAKEGYRRYFRQFLTHSTCLIPTRLGKARKRWLELGKL